MLSTPNHITSSTLFKSTSHFISFLSFRANSLEKSIYLYSLKLFPYCFLNLEKLGFLHNSHHSTKLFLSKLAIVFRLPNQFSVFIVNDLLVALIIIDTPLF